MPATNYMKNKALDLFFGEQAYDVPNTIYAGLCTDCDSSGTITGEPSTAAGYARVSIVNNDIATVWSSASAGVKTNANSKIQYPTITSSDWGTLDTFFLSDGSTAGNILWYSTMAALVTAVGMAPYIDTNNLTITIST